MLQHCVIFWMSTRQSSMAINLQTMKLLKALLSLTPNYHTAIKPKLYLQENSQQGVTKLTLYHSVCIRK